MLLNLEVCRTPLGGDIQTLSRVMAGQRKAGLPIQSRSLIIPDGTIRNAINLGYPSDGFSTGSFFFSKDFTRLNTPVPSINSKIIKNLVID